MDYFVRQIVAHCMDTIELFFMMMDELLIGFTCGHTARAVDDVGVHLLRDVSLMVWCLPKSHGTDSTLPIFTQFNQVG